MGRDREQEARNPPLGATGHNLSLLEAEFQAVVLPGQSLDLARRETQFVYAQAGCLATGYQ